MADKCENRTFAGNKSTLNLKGGVSRDYPSNHIVVQPVAMKFNPDVIL